jgi:GMP synthase-like glutamine amidotransferase
MARGLIALPAGAQLLASSALCQVQMYRVTSRQIGVQFHPEWDASVLAALAAHFAEQYPSALSQVDAKRIRDAKNWLFSALDDWWGER